MAKEKKEDKPADEALHAEKAEATPTTFKAKVNKYAFLHLPKSLREAWGLTKGVEQPVNIELIPEGALIIRKA